MSRFDVAVVGSGLIGLTATLAMAKVGYRVALVANHPLEPLTKDNLRYYAINFNSQKLWQDLGVWSNINKRKISVYQGMQVWDGLTGNTIEWQSQLISAPYLGTILSHKIIYNALLKTLESYSNISLFINTEVDTLKISFNKVNLNPLNLEAKLLLIADGAESPLREHLKIKMHRIPYYQQAIISLITTEKPHQKIAYQSFTPQGILAYLPLKESHQSSIVWSVEEAYAKALMALDEQAFNHAVAENLQYKLGTVVESFGRQSFDLIKRHAEQYVGSSWLLLGDAAHTIHPMAGLGLNIGLEDIKVWLEQLADCRYRLNSIKALNRYQRHRKANVGQLIIGLDSLKRLFSASSTPIIQLRNLGINYANQWLGLKRWLIYQASGMAYNQLALDEHDDASD